MSIALFVQAVRRYWLVVVACTVAGILAALLATHLATKKYSASSEVLVSVSSGRSASDVAQGSDYALRQMTTYAGMVTSAAVLQPVIDQLKLNTNVSDLAAHVSASNPIDTLLMDISVQDTDPEKASRIANAVAAQFSSVIKALSPYPAGAKVVTATTITPAVASASANPTSPSPTLNLAVGTLGGLGVGALMAQLALVAAHRRPFPTVRAESATPTQGKA